MRYIYFLRAIHCRCQVGNKIDLQQAVSSAEHSNAVSNCGLELQARTSAKTGEGVSEAFTTLIISIFDKDKGSSGTDRARSGNTRRLGDPQQKRSTETHCTC